MNRRHFDEADRSNRRARESIRMIFLLLDLASKGVHAVDHLDALTDCYADQDWIWRDEADFHRSTGPVSLICRILCISDRPASTLG